METKYKQKASRRLKIIQGQLKGLQQMVEKEAYCVDIITQSSAIKEALAGVDTLILENHLTTHVLHQIKSGQQKKAIAEILKVYTLAQKKK
ncbi:MAG: metal-sensitive transcriptional regulator [Patescibacteria group bacterium]